MSEGRMKVVKQTKRVPIWSISFSYAKDRKKVGGSQKR